MIYGPTNIEGYPTELSSAMILSKYLFQGESINWYDGEGFGTPIPKLLTFTKHHIFYFVEILGLRLSLAIFWISQLTIGCYFFWKIFSQLKIKEPIGLICSICLVFSASNFMYSYTDDHIAPWFVWSMVPLIIFKINDLYINPIKEIYDVRIFLYAISFSFIIYNGLPSYLFAQFIPIAAYTLYNHFHLSKKIEIKYVLIIAVLILLMLLPFIYHYVNELGLFPSNIKRQLNPQLKIFDYGWNLFPLDDDSVKQILSLDFYNAYITIKNRFLSSYSRAPLSE